MQEEIELCERYCPTDCKYRSSIQSGSVPICYYAVIENVPTRGCKISECDKYIPGQPIKPTLRKDLIIEWLYETYGRTDDDNTLW